MAEKVLILGGSGMLGWQVTNLLSKNYPNISITVSNAKSSQA